MKADKTQSTVDRNPPVSGWNLKYIQNASFEIFHALIDLVWRTRWCTWLRHCATSRKVAGSIPHGVTGIFIDIILPAAYSPGVDTLRVKVGCAYGWQPYLLVSKSVGLNLPEPSGPVIGLTGIALPSYRKQFQIKVVLYIYIYQFLHD